MPERQQEKLLANLDKVKVPFNLPQKEKAPSCGWGVMISLLPLLLSAACLYPLIFCSQIWKYVKISPQDGDGKIDMEEFRQLFNKKWKWFSRSYLFLFLSPFCNCDAKLMAFEWKHTIKEMDRVLYNTKKYGKKCFSKSSDPWKSFSLCKIHFGYIYVIQNNKETIKLWFKLVNKQEFIWYGKYWKGEITIELSKTENAQNLWENRQ